MANSLWRHIQFCGCVFFVVFAALGVDSQGSTPAWVTAMKAEDSQFAVQEQNMLVVTAEVQVLLRLFGRGLQSQTTLSFTNVGATRGGSCNDMRHTGIFQLVPGSLSSVDDETNIISAVADLNFADTYDGEILYLCTKQSWDTEDGNTTYPNETSAMVPVAGLEAAWVHQGDAEWLRIRIVPKPVKKTLLPIWLQAIFIVLLLCLSGLFSGLNLGLMSLDKTELKIVENVGSPQEKKYAKAIIPLRKRGNFLLCTILLGNVLVNNTLTILLDDLTGSGGAAIIGATAGIVVFGEIIPQAVCSRHGLAIGARTINITKFFMILTFPVSFPISKVLDCVLGEEMGNVYDRNRLRELLRVTEENLDLVKDEMNIITGALELSRKTVLDVMTKLEDVYMIEYNSSLDFETISAIMKTGYTRIPVFEKEKVNVVALLNIKDLAFIDPDDRTPLKTVCRFYNHPVNYVFEDTKLDVMLEEFKKGKSHMSFVRCVNNKGEGDPFYETLGVVTLEDVIEEIIQSEIVDETDTVTDNRQKAPRKPQNVDFSVFHQPADVNYKQLSPQLSLAIYQFLSTSVPPFHDDYISQNVLTRLIKQNVVENFTLKDPQAPETMLYTRGKNCDFFILILQGRTEVDIGKEHFMFEGGPFMHFGTQALTGMSSSLSKQQSISSINITSDSAYTKSKDYAPDYSVRAQSDLQYLKIRRAHYVAARRATLMERQRTKTPEDNLEDPFAKEWKRATSIHPDMCNNVNNKTDGDSTHNDSHDNISVSAVSPSVDGDASGRTRSDTQDSVGSPAVDSPLISSCETMPDTKETASV